MAQDTTFLKIGNHVVQKITKFDVGQNRLYAADSGRDLAGVNHATLIGIYPKIEVGVAQYSQSEMRAFLNAVDTGKHGLSVTWWDEKSGKVRTGESYYINDFTISLVDAKTMRYHPFEFNLIPNTKRGD